MKTLLTFVAVALLAVSAIAQETQQKSMLTDADQLQIAVQKICPVSGGALGSMGDPVKVKVGEQVAFLCCKGCQGKQLNAEHWKTIQTNIAAAQGTCPIMGKPVDASMKSTVVNGQQVFVCCPPCIAKIQADADGSLKKVNASYVSFVAKERQAKSDQLHARRKASARCLARSLVLWALQSKSKWAKRKSLSFAAKAASAKHSTQNIGRQSRPTLLLLRKRAR